MSDELRLGDLRLADMESIRIRTPSRLHFGLLRAAGEGPLCGGPLFGGVGAMIDRPGVELSLARNSEFSAMGPMSERVRKFAAAWTAHHRLSKPPAWTIEVVAAPPEHVGLGVGTQLGLAVSAGLSIAHTGILPSIAELASAVERGARSAVGAHGFALGGLIIDAGKSVHEGLSPLASRIELPDEWRFLLLRLRDDRGLSGTDERQAFADLPPPTKETTAALQSLLYEQLAPAALAGDFEPFAAALYEYGRLAGTCFSSRQGGPWRGEGVTSLVTGLRELGVLGVGQSSWGPTVYALAPGDAAAEEYSRLTNERWGDAVECIIASPNNIGAEIVGQWSVPARRHRRFTFQSAIA